MSIPHRCPICEGRGEVGPRLAQTGAELISKKPQRFECHGCARTGIVWDHSFQLNIAPTVTPQPIVTKPWINDYPGPSVTWINSQNNNGVLDACTCELRVGYFGEGHNESCPQHVASKAVRCHEQNHHI